MFLTLMGVILKQMESSIAGHCCCPGLEMQVDFLIHFLAKAYTMVTDAPSWPASQSDSHLTDLKMY